MSSSTSSVRLNQEWILSTRPSGLPDSTNWQLRSTPYPTVGEDQIIVKTKYVSVDPYLRGVIKLAPLNEPTVSGIVGEVVESKHSGYKVGDIITTYAGWRLYNAVTPRPESGTRKIDPSWGPISTALGVLGMPGQTAFFGLFDVGAFKPTDTVLVSGAAGAVGSIVIQLAKLKGATNVIGTAGGTDKVKFVKSLGADYAIDYKLHNTAESVSVELKKAAPKGIDFYFDNTGGHVTDAVWPLLNKFGRVAVCGAISMYNETKPADHPNFLGQLIYKSVTVRGFVVSDFAKEFGRFFEQVPNLVKEGKLKFTETVVDGFEKIPQSFIGLFQGANTGKAVVKVD